MKGQWRFTLFLFLAPVLALLVSYMCVGKLDSELRRTVAAQRQDLTPDALKEVTVRRLLVAQDSSELAPVRAEMLRLDLMRAGAWIMIAIIVLFNAALWTAGRLAARNRSLLLHVFKPGFYASSLVLIVTTIINAALFMASIYYGETYLFEMFHPQVLILIGIGAVIGASAIVKALVSSRKRASARVFGRILREDEHPLTWAHIRGMAKRVGSLAPENIVVGLDPTFFVTETDVESLDTKLKGRTLFLSAPLCRLLSADQFDAILGHELGHYKGEDTRFSREFYPIYRGLIASLQGLQIAARGWMVLAVLPSIWMFSSFLQSFAAAETKLSRERELAADACASSATSARTFAVALTRVVAASPYWLKLDEDAVRTLRDGQPLTNVSAFISSAISARHLPAIPGQLVEQKMAHPTDTHPPLMVRLDNLGIGFDSIKDDICLPVTEIPAIGLIDGAEALEESLTKAYRDDLARRFYFKA
jgi:Zn-dependent protease with chaperone function